MGQRENGLQTGTREALMVARPILENLCSLAHLDAQEKYNVN